MFSFLFVFGFLCVAHSIEHTHTFESIPFALLKLNNIFPITSPET